MTNQMIKKRISTYNKNIRIRTIIIIILTSLLLVTMLSIGVWIDKDQIGIDLLRKNEAPSMEFLFGTDWLGRDMLFRTLKGLTLSFGVGILAAFSSTVLALLLSFLAAWSKVTDNIVTWLIDLFLSVPHLVTLILITFAFGGGFKGVVIGLALTHWPQLTRLLRSEIMQVQTAEYVAVSKRLGRSKGWIARHHLLPHLIPQLVIGFVLMFPHAILHEAAITFLGFGLSSESPAIGIILSESMQYLSIGLWWLAFFPGLALLLMVGIFDALGRNIRLLMDPFHGQRG